MSVNRRAFLSALAAAPVTGKAMVGEASKALAGAAVPAGVVASSTLGPPLGVVGEAWSQDKEDARAALYDVVGRIRAQRGIGHGQERLPDSVAGMKSWSPAFKRHVAVEMEEDLSARTQALFEDGLLFKLLGIE